MKRLSTLVAALLVAGLFGCGDETPPPTPPSFDRPGRVAFACFQTNGRDAPQVWPMRLCEDKELQESNEADLSVHAIVTQTSRGEVAAVDTERRRVLDSRNDIPGYTFLPVGELPSAVVVPRAHPQQTYVANYGSRTITVLRTGAFRDLSVGESAAVQTVDVRVPGAADALAPVDMVVTPDERALIVALPEAGKLMVLPITRCEQSADADASIACEDGEIDTDAIREISLDDSIGMAVITDDEARIEREPYRFVCAPGALLPAPDHIGAVLPPDAASLPPQPTSLTVDALCPQGKECARRLLVADRSQPVVHVLDLDALARGDDALLPPIVTGVPTSAVAVTPRVPRSLDSEDGSTQYVYAIDATDGSVLVTQDGQLLSVSSDPATRPDRIALGVALSTGDAVASTLTVLTPGFETDRSPQQYSTSRGSSPSAPVGSGRLCVDDEHIERSQARLRGVFLAVGLTDGTVRIVDVHDMDLADCRKCDAELPDPYPVVRHHTRIAATHDPEQDAPGLIPPTQPSFIIGADAFLVAIDGTTRDPRVEGLSCVPCAAPLLASFPDPADLVVDSDAGDAGGMLETPDAATDAAIDASSEPSLDASAADAAAADGGMGDPDAGIFTIAHGPGLGHRCPTGEARVCTLGDPWSAVDDWQAIYEGIIPGTRGGHGRFIDVGSPENETGGVEFTGEIDFCAGGAQARDQLVITSEMPPLESIKESLRDGCEKLDALRDENGLIAFEIKAVRGDRVQIDTKVIADDSRDWTFVSKCFGNMLVSYDMRTLGAFMVVSPDRLGFLHRNVLDEATNRCEIDSAQSPLRRGRAYEDKPFTNSVISFEIAGKQNDAGERIPPLPSTILYITVSSPAPKLLFDGNITSFERLHGVLPVDVRYSTENETLYIVDQAVRGLIPVPTDLFPAASSLSFQ